MKQDASTMCNEKGCDADDENTEYEKELKEFFANAMEKLYFQAYESYIHTSYFYLFKHYYVIRENLSPPPEMG
ncbi:MAG: hypothetical protein ACKVTZ_18410 [Bacteroidia bacterium]